MSEKIYINNDWLFTGTYTDEVSLGDVAPDSMEQVQIPHTVQETPFHYFDEETYQMVSGYRRILSIPSEWKGKSIRLTFEAVAHRAEVYLNGEKLAEHACGYTAFTVDLTDKLRFGSDNILALKVDSRESLDQPPFGFVIDYMTYGGIYRDVYLEVSGPTYLKDVFLYSEIRDREAVLHTHLQVQNPGKRPLKIRQYLGEEELKLTDGVSFRYKSLPVSVSLWDVDHPVLYDIRTDLTDAESGEIYDSRTDQFGFRTSEFKNDGYYLNGRKLKIRGLNRHQSYPYVGYAMPASMQIQDADILKKELGVNAVRTSHYPQSQDFIRRCDEIGLLVFTEIPGWQHIGGKDWQDQAVLNVREMVLQYRNHPSIILWGVRINESADLDEFYKRTNDEARKLDPTRPTGGVRAGKKSHLLEDVYTYNDFVHDGGSRGCERKKDVTSDMKKAYLVSEYNGHMYSTKAFDWEGHRREHAIRHANVLNSIGGEEDIAGSFGWCMFDYNTHKDFGSGDRICYHGVMDMFRNPKMAAAVYACQQDQLPVLELSSSMDIGEHPGCNRGETYIFTNADSVRMYKNDRFLKEYVPQDSSYKHLKHGPILSDDFIGDAVEEGEKDRPAGVRRDLKDALNSVARFGMGNLPKRIYLLAAKLMIFHHMNFGEAVKLYNKYIGDWGGKSTVYRFEAVRDGKVIKTMVKAPASGRHLEALVSSNTLTEGRSYDVAGIRLKAVDDQGNLMPYFQEPVTFTTEGPIRLIGPGLISLQGGMGGTYIRTEGTAGHAALIASCPGCDDVKIEFDILKQEEETWTDQK